MMMMMIMMRHMSKAYLRTQSPDRAKETDGETGKDRHTETVRKTDSQ